MSAKPNLQPTLQALLDRDRRGLDEHPTPEALVAYHAGELSSAEQEDLRNHLALCHDCADLLLDLVSFAEFTPPDQIPALADVEVEGAWQKFQPRLAAREEPPERRVEERLPAVAQIAERRRDMDQGSEYAVVSWRRKIRVAYAIAASLFIAVVALSAWGLALRQKTIQVSQTHQSAALDLFTPEAATTRGEPESQPTVPPELGFFNLTVHLEPEWTFGSYEVEIRRADHTGRSVTVHGLVDQDGTCSISTLSREDFPAGQYQVDLYGIAGSGKEKEKLAQYQFQIAAQQ